jgi:hypothetical protein
MSDKTPAPEAGVDEADAPIEPAVFDLPLPVDNSNDALPNLRRPFAPGAVKWKVQSEWPSEGEADGAIIVGYLDARLVSARLNKVVGGAWSEKPVRVADNTNSLLCELTVFEQTHIDIGIGQGRGDEMKQKAVHSDSLKRVAVRFGVGESIHAMPEIRLGVTADGSEETDGTPTIKRVTKGKRKGRAGYLSEKVEAYLRKRYEDWLNQHGEQAFGPVLDHGDDAAGSVGEGVEPPATEEDAPDPSAPLDDDRAKELGEAARKLRDEIRALDEGALPNQSFDAAMGQREHSHERLEDFVGNLTEMLADVKRFEDLRGQLAAKLDEADLKKVVDRAKRRASRRERVESLEKALADAEGEGSSDGE